MRAALALTVFLAMPAVAAVAQGPPSLDDVLDRFGRYLLAYEAELSALTAEETYSQGEYRGTGSGLPAFNRRKLESDIAFLRLPGDGEWLGVRDVRKVDGRLLPGGAKRLPDLLEAAGPDTLAQARAIVIASSKHNLGEPRTINMPTAPLELVHPRNHPRLIFKLGSFENVDRVRTIRLEFEEFDSPTMVHDALGNEILTRGIAWVEPDSGRLRRVQGQHDAIVDRLSRPHRRWQFPPRGIHDGAAAADPGAEGDDRAVRRQARTWRGPGALHQLPAVHDLRADRAAVTRDA